MAGREGFEPSVEVLIPYNHLAGDPVQPLRHLPNIHFAAGKLAEGEGFEPTLAFTKPVFKTGALNHSAIPPLFLCRV